MAFHVVALEFIGKSNINVSGLALCAPGKPALVFTLADVKLHPAPHEIRVSFIMKNDMVLTLDAKVAASGTVIPAKRAFQSLSIRGWRCGSATVFPVHLLRTDDPLPEDFSSSSLEIALGCGPGAAWGTEPDDEWSGASIEITAAPFGAIPSASLARMVTQGVIVNISNPEGLLMLDARCLDGSAGAAVIMTETMTCVGRGTIVACVCPPMKSYSSESIAYNLAVPLFYIAASIVDDPALACKLLPQELALLMPSAPLPLLKLPSPISLRRDRVRRSVALLWLESTGSWASGIIISNTGHVLTCAHFLTGRSWVEIPLEAEANASGANGAQPKEKPPPAPVRPPPRSCRGRVSKMGPDGKFAETAFEADVIHIFDGCLDAALLKIRQGKAHSQEHSFETISWPSPSVVPQPGTEVWAVGHGLFGLGTPWRGPAITRGHITKVAFGQGTKRAAVIQSSAAVHRGCSGGALVDARSGELLGLVTTNVKHQDGTVMPHVNFSLPVTLLSPLRQFSSDLDDPPDLARLLDSWQISAADPQEQSLWRLEPEGIDLPSHVEERKQQALDLMARLAAEAEAAEANAGVNTAATARVTAEQPPRAKL